MKYAVRVQSRLALSADGSAMTKDGEWFWLRKAQWVPATSIRTDLSRGVPEDVKLFDTKKAAREFAENWLGDPWWVRPNGRYHVVALTPRMVTVQDGWNAERVYTYGRPV